MAFARLAGAANPARLVRIDRDTIALFHTRDTNANLVNLA